MQLAEQVVRAEVVRTDGGVEFTGGVQEICDTRRITQEVTLPFVRQCRGCTGRGLAMLEITSSAARTSIQGKNSFSRLGISRPHTGHLWAGGTHELGVPMAHRDAHFLGDNLVQKSA